MCPDIQSASGRSAQVSLIAVFESHQSADGSVVVPEPLRRLL